MYYRDRAGFVEVSKQTSLVMQTLVYRLAEGLHGPHLAVRHVGGLAAAAWSRDLERAQRLYELIQVHGGRLDDEQVPDELQASQPVSQDVEVAILAEACVRLGVDPEQQPERQAGRPQANGEKAGW